MPPPEVHLFDPTEGLRAASRASGRCRRTGHGERVAVDLADQRGAGLPLHVALLPDRDGRSVEALPIEEQGDVQWQTGATLVGEIDGDTLTVTGSAASS